MGDCVTLGQREGELELRAFAMHEKEEFAWIFQQETSKWSLLYTKPIRHGIRIYMNPQDYSGEIILYHIHPKFVMGQNNRKILTFPITKPYFYERLSNNSELRPKIKNYQRYLIQMKRIPEVNAGSLLLHLPTKSDLAITKKLKRDCSDSTAGIVTPYGVINVKYIGDVESELDNTLQVYEENIFKKTLTFPLECGDSTFEEAIPNFFDVIKESLEGLFEINFKLFD